MGSATIRSGFDSYSGSVHPSREHAKATRLRLKSGQNYAYIYLRSPAPLGATIVSATLTVFARNATSGSRTLTASRIGESWKARSLNWNNAPDVLSGGATAAVDVLADADPVDFDVTAHVQTVANGGRHFGWRIETTGASLHWLYAFNAGEHKPRLVVEWSDAPDAPTSLAPADSVVSLAAPVVQFDYTDVSGSTDLAAVQVQVDPAADDVTPDFDSGEVAATEPELDLSATAYLGLADAASTYWRARVKDAAGLWSDWSDWVQITRAVKGTVTIDTPSAGTPIVTDHTPTIEWTPSATQTAWKIRITRASDRGTELYDSGKRIGAETAHTIPDGYMPADDDYSVQVRSWDATADRQASPGDPRYAYAWLDFVITDDPAVTKPTTTTAASVADAPWVDVEWTAAVEPNDGWNVYRDGELIAGGLETADWLVAGTTYTYRWRDYTAAPLRPHTYSVRGVVDGVRSEPTSSGPTTTRPIGIYLADAATGTTVRIAGDEAGSWSMEDDAATLVPLGSTATVRIVSGLRGMSGQLSGLLLDDWAGVTLDAAEAAVWAMKARPSRPVRLVAGDVNLSVLLGNVTVAPTAYTREGQLVKDISFDLWQTGAAAFEAWL